MNMVVKIMALSLLPASVLVSCMVENHEDGLYHTGDEQVANYQVLGTVRGKDGHPLTGIRVVAGHSTGVLYRADTLYTDKDGKFSKFMSVPRVDKFYMSFSDIDGQANGGEFEKKSEYVSPVRTEISSGHFGGSYIVSIDVTLKKK